MYYDPFLAAHAASAADPNYRLQVSTDESFGARTSAARHPGPIRRPIIRTNRSDVDPDSSSSSTDNVNIIPVDPVEAYELLINSLLDETNNVVIDHACTECLSQDTNSTASLLEFVDNLMDTENDSSDNIYSNTSIDSVITTVSNIEFFTECSPIGQPLYTKCLTSTYTTVTASININEKLCNGIIKVENDDYYFAEEKIKRAYDTAKYLVKMDNFMPVNTDFIVNMNNGEEPNKNGSNANKYEIFPKESPNTQREGNAPLTFWHYEPNDNLPNIDSLSDFIYSGSNTNLNIPVERETYFPPLEEPVEVPGIVYNPLTQEFGYHSPRRDIPNRYDEDLVETPNDTNIVNDEYTVIAGTSVNTESFVNTETVVNTETPVNTANTSQADTSKKHWDNDDQNFMFSSGVTHLFDYFLNPNEENQTKLKTYFGNDLFDEPGRFNEVLFGGNRPESRNGDAELISLDSLSLFDFLDEDTNQTNPPVDPTSPVTNSSVTFRSVSANSALTKNKCDTEKTNNKPQPRPITKSRSLNTIQTDANETASSVDDNTNNSSSSCNSEATLSNYPRAITKNNECNNPVNENNNGVQILAVQPPKRPIIKTNNLTRNLDLKNAASDDGKQGFLRKVNRSKEIKSCGLQSSSNLRAITKRGNDVSNDNSSCSSSTSSCNSSIVTQTDANAEIALSNNPTTESPSNQSVPQNSDAANTQTNANAASELIKKEFFKRVWEMVRNRQTMSNPRPITKKNDEHDIK